MPLSRVKTKLIKYDNPLEMDKEPTPDNPEVGSAKLYFKNDDNLYKKTADGQENRVGSDLLNALRIDLENQISEAGQDNAADIFTNFVKDMEDHGRTAIHTERGFVDELEIPNELIDETNSTGFRYDSTGDFYTNQIGISGVSTKDYNTESEYITGDLTKELLSTSTVSIVTESDEVSNNGYSGFKEVTIADPRTDNLSPNPNTVTLRKAVTVSILFQSFMILDEGGTIDKFSLSLRRVGANSTGQVTLHIIDFIDFSNSLSSIPTEGIPLGAPIFSMTRDCVDISTALLPGFTDEILTSATSGNQSSSFNTGAGDFIDFVIPVSQQPLRFKERQLYTMVLTSTSPNIAVNNSDYSMIDWNLDDEPTAQDTGPTISDTIGNGLGRIRKGNAGTAGSVAVNGTVLIARSQFSQSYGNWLTNSNVGGNHIFKIFGTRSRAVITSGTWPTNIIGAKISVDGGTTFKNIIARKSDTELILEDDGSAPITGTQVDYIIRRHNFSAGSFEFNDDTSPSETEFLLLNKEPLYTFGLNNQLLGGSKSNGGSVFKPLDPNNEKIDIATYVIPMPVFSDQGPAILTKAEIFMYLNSDSGSGSIQPEGTIRAEVQLGANNSTEQAVIGGSRINGTNRNNGYIPVDAWRVDTTPVSTPEAASLRTKLGLQQEPTNGNSFSNGITLSKSDETIFAKDQPVKSLNSLTAADMPSTKVTFNFTNNPLVLYPGLTYTLNLVAEGINNNETSGTPTRDTQISGYKVFAKKVPRGFDFTGDKYTSVLDSEVELQNTSNWRTVTPITVDENTESGENIKSDISNITSITDTFNINHFNSTGLTGTDFEFGSKNSKYLSQTFIYGNQTSFQNIRIKKTGNGTPGNIRYFLYYHQDGKIIGDALVQSNADIIDTNVTTAYQTFNMPMVEFGTSIGLSSNALGTNNSRYCLVIEHLGTSDVDCYAVEGSTPNASNDVTEIFATYSNNSIIKTESRPYYWLGFDPAVNFGNGTEVKIFNRASSVWRTIAQNDGTVWKFNSFAKDYTKLLLPFEGDEKTTTFADSTGNHTISSTSTVKTYGRHIGTGQVNPQGVVIYQQVPIGKYDSGTIVSFTNYAFEATSSPGMTGQLICQIYNARAIPGLAGSGPFGQPIATSNETVDLTTIANQQILPGPTGGIARGTKLVWTFPANFILSTIQGTNTTGTAISPNHVFFCFRVISGNAASSFLRFNGTPNGGNVYYINTDVSANSNTSPFEIDSTEYNLKYFATNSGSGASVSTGTMIYELKLNVTPHITECPFGARFRGTGVVSGQAAPFVNTTYKPTIKLNSRISTEISSDFNLGTDDFTVDFWYTMGRDISFNGANASLINPFDIPFTIHNASSQYRTSQQLYLRLGGPFNLNPTIHYFDQNGNEIIQKYGLLPISASNQGLFWTNASTSPTHHFAIVRHNNTIKLYIDGTEVPLMRSYNQVHYEKILPVNLGITNAKITIGGQIPGVHREPDKENATLIENFDLNHNTTSRSGRNILFGSTANQYISHKFNPTGNSLDNIRIRKTGNGTPGNIILKVYAMEDRGNQNTVSTPLFRYNSFIGDPELISSTVLTPNQITNSFQNFSFSFNPGELSTDQGGFLRTNWFGGLTGSSRVFMLEHEDAATLATGNNSQLAPYTIEGGTNTNSSSPTNAYSYPGHIGEKPIDGYMQEFRFTNGKALWKNNFTPPNDRTTIVANNISQSASTFVGSNASVNTLLGAVNQAIEIEENRMTKEDLESITEAEFLSTGGFNFNINKLFRGFTLLSKYNRNKSSVNEFTINFVSDDEAVDIKSKQWTGTSGTPDAPTTSPDTMYLFVVDEQTSGTPQYQVTRDGSTYTNVTFDADWRFDGTKTVRRATIDVSSLPAGTDPRLRVTNQVNEQYKLHAVGLQTK